MNRLALVAFVLPALITRSAIADCGAIPFMAHVAIFEPDQLVAARAGRLLQRRT